MRDWDDVVAYACSLPEVEMGPYYRAIVPTVNGRGFVGPAREADSFGVRTSSIEEKHMLIETDPATFWETPQNEIVVTATRSLTQCEIDHASSFFGSMNFPTDHLSQVRFLNPGASELVADIFRSGSAIAVTRGNDIYVKEGYWDIVTNPANTVFWHELVHTVQYARFGRYFEELYAAAGVSTSSYKRNPFEVQARELGSDLASGFKGC